MRISVVSNTAEVSAVIVLLQTRLIFRDDQYNGDTFPFSSARNIIIPPCEIPSLRLEYDASENAISLIDALSLLNFKQMFSLFTFFATLFANKMSLTVASFNLALSWQTSYEISGLDCLHIQFKLPTNGTIS